MSGDKKSGKVYPHIWIVGPDPLKHEIHQNYLKAKAQAMFRKEGWKFTIDEFFSMWQNDWSNRGRGSDNVCMTRRDPNKPWSKENCYIITRREHLAEQGRQRSAKNMRYKTGKTSKPKYYKMRIDL